MKYFNRDCKTCLSKNEAINKGIKKNEQLWENPDDAFTFHILCTLDLKYSCCKAKYVDDKSLEFVNVSVDDPVCTTGMCSWDMLKDKKPKLDNYYDMYGMCYDDNDFTGTGSSIFKEATDKDVEKSIATLHEPITPEACGDEQISFKSSLNRFRVKEGSWNINQPVKDFADELTKMNFIVASPLITADDGSDLDLKDCQFTSNQTFNCKYFRYLSCLILYDIIVIYCKNGKLMVQETAFLQNIKHYQLSADVMKD